jgi:hypothetical protein
VTRPANLPELAAHLAGETPATVMCSGDDMRALLAYISELEHANTLRERMMKKDVALFLRYDARVAELEAALRPLATVAETIGRIDPNEALIPDDTCLSSITDLTLGHARAARRALESPTKE